MDTTHEIKELVCRMSEAADAAALSRAIPENLIASFKLGFLEDHLISALAVTPLAYRRALAGIYPLKRRSD